MSRFPCPCCGHLTLGRGPGDYELCPICFWEDDGAQLRFPMSPDGANGISLAEAQRAYGRHGAMDKAFQRKVRKPLADEPLDEGWRPFDPTTDWTEPALESERWPVNLAALYYWRSTYWNGDQHKLPRPASEETNADRFLMHLRQVPELDAAIAAVEQRWGAAHAFKVCEAASDLALEAYRSGAGHRALAIVHALLPALAEESATYSPNCVTIGFLENEGWHDSEVQEFIDRWPAQIRDELRAQQARRREHFVAASNRHDQWTLLLRSGRGQPVEMLEQQLRALQDRPLDHPTEELGRQLAARVLSNPHWLYRHPVDSLRLAWRYRRVRSPWRTLAGLRRLRWAG